MARHSRITHKEFKSFLDDSTRALLTNCCGNRSKTADLADTVTEAAKKRLRESRDAAEALEAIREIASNLLGCETMLLLRFDRKMDAYCPFWSFGVAAEKRSLIKALEEPASYCAALGSTYIIGDLEDQNPSKHHPKVAVFVPIRHYGEIEAVLALLQFLPQKLGLDKIDNEVFRVLSEEAGSKLFCQTPAAPPANSLERKS